ncbi:ABC transporter [Aeromonas hydrophila]|nr:ABC transporter [Aeromonas hydrophila]
MCCRFNCCPESALMNELLRVEHLIIRHGERVLVDDVSFTLLPGRPFTLLGRSGAGKSLTMQAIMGTLPPSLSMEGSIWLGERCLSTLPATARRALWGRTLAMLPQEPWRALDPTRHAGLQIRDVFHWVRGWRRSTARKGTDKLLERLALTSHQYKYPGELSGGMCQRITVAMAQAAGAQLLLADEPTKGLDESMKQEVASRLREACGEERLLLTITHDVALADVLGGDVGILCEGRLVECGEASQVLVNPAQDYTRTLLRAEPRHWPNWHKVARSQPWLIRAEQLGHRIGEQTLFDGINLTLAPGQVTVLTGPSGGGKTTLGNLVTGFRPLQQGAIMRQPLLCDEQIQKLYQDPPAAFINRLPLAVQFADLQKRHGIERSRVDHWLEQLGLSPDLLVNTPEQVSGGELQRLALARAMLLNPKVLFADEATSRLDPISQQQVISVLKQCVERDGLSLLLVSHDTHLVKHMADEVVTVGMN